MKKVTIYTDGACSGNPGPGGWGAILMYKQHKSEISGGEKDTTNNRMEMMAVLQALSALKEPCEVDLYTDSAYIYNCFTKNWIYNWKKNGWKTSAKKEVLNQDLWEQLFRLSHTHKITWNKVKGHADNAYNNRCDALACSQRDKYKSSSLL